MTDLDAIVARHVPRESVSGRRYCAEEGYDVAWPCDARIVLDALDEAVLETAASVMKEAEAREAKVVAYCDDEWNAVDENYDGNLYGTDDWREDIKRLLAVPDRTP